MFLYFQFEFLRYLLNIKLPSWIEQLSSSILYNISSINNCLTRQLPVFLFFIRFQSQLYTLRSLEVCAGFCHRVSLFLVKIHLNISYSNLWNYSKVHLPNIIFLTIYNHNNHSTLEGCGCNFQSKFNITNGSVYPFYSAF